MFFAWEGRASSEQTSASLEDVMFFPFPAVIELFEDARFPCFYGNWSGSFPCFYGSRTLGTQNFSIFLYEMKEGGRFPCSMWVELFGAWKVSIFILKLHCLECGKFPWLYENWTLWTRGCFHVSTVPCYQWKLSPNSVETTLLHQTRNIA